MQRLSTVQAMQQEADAARSAGRRLVLVPTMGALHEGHLALVQAARHHGDHVTVSIFVNPTQFGPGEDFEQYPRTLEADLAALQAVGGAEVVFTPTVEAFYPDGPAMQRTWVTVTELDAHLCGAHRPGHFQGVTTVVAKLFHACRPHVAVFGRKDAQQLLILRRMARDLNLGIELVGVPTVREPDGLARSSRNRFLSPAERAQAPVLYQALQATEGAIRGGERRTEALVEGLRRHLGTAPDARIQYASLVDTERLQPVETLPLHGEVLVAVAVYFGATRLIDNVFVQVP
ncbi:MAG: pantoate--beta-alanine ligase [Bacteroidota bacterium]